MPITSVFILAGIILAFTVFAVVLAWGEYQTRHINRSGQQHAGTSVQIHSLTKVAQDIDRGRPRPRKGEALDAARNGSNDNPSWQADR